MLFCRRKCPTPRLKGGTAIDFACNFRYRFFEVYFIDCFFILCDLIVVFPVARRLVIVYNSPAALDASALETVCWFPSRMQKSVASKPIEDQEAIVAVFRDVARVLLLLQRVCHSIVDMHGLVVYA